MHDLEASVQALKHAQVHDLCAVTPQPTAYQLKSGRLTSHGRLLEWLDDLPRGSRILDVGTATGYLGKALQQRGFTELYGLERHPTWAAQARPYYRQLEVFDVERQVLPWAPESMDVILCADLLEHLQEPQAALSQLMRLLQPQGWLLASIPNVAHWSVRAELFIGRFKYQDSGILDRAHLRFFTRRSAQALLQGAGLVIHREAATPLPIARWCATSPWSFLWRGIESVDGFLSRLRPSLFAYQFLFACQLPQAVWHDL